MIDKGKFKLCLQLNMQLSVLTMLLTHLLPLCKELTAMLLHELWGCSVSSQIYTASWINWNGALIDACYSEEMVYISGVISRRAVLLFLY